LSAALRNPAAKDNKELTQFSLKAAEAGLKVAGEKDAMALLNVADAHFAAGDAAKAKDFGQRAVAASADESAAMKRYIETQVKKYEEK